MVNALHSHAGLQLQFKRMVLSRLQQRSTVLAPFCEDAYDGIIRIVWDDLLGLYGRVRANELRRVIHGVLMVRKSESTMRQRVKAQQAAEGKKGLGLSFEDVQLVGPYRILSHLHLLVQARREDVFKQLQCKQRVALVNMLTPPYEEWPAVHTNMKKEHLIERAVEVVTRPYADVYNFEGFLSSLDKPRWR